MTSSIVIQKTQTDVNKALAVALAAGIGTGAAAVYENPLSSFSMALLQAGVVAGGVSYLMPSYSCERQAAAVAIAMAASCGGLQGFSTPSCLKFGAISGLAAYAGLYFLEPTLEKELNSVRGKK